MICPQCKEKTHVLETRVLKGHRKHALKRRRECLSCGHRYNTVEMDGDVFEEWKAVKRKLSHLTKTVQSLLS